MENQVLALLRETRRVLETSGWTRQSYGRRPDGSRCLPGDPAASCFCLVGALNRARGNLDVSLEVFHLAYTALKQLVGDATLPAWNDRQGEVAPVLALIDRAVENEQEVSGG